MRILILVERLSRDHYRARSGEPLSLTAEGPSSLEAEQKLKRLIQEKLRNGSELTELTIPTATEARSWPPAPIYDENDPMVQEWLEIMKENRKKEDEGPDFP
jgi:hypothetical protein